MDKNPKRLIPYVPKTLLDPSGIGKRKFSVNFECYDLANGEE
jgi:hypothetical protein